MELIEFLKFYLSSSDEVKRQIVEILEESQSQNERRAEPVHTEKTS